MSHGWSVSLALASLEDEIWSATPFRGIGLIQPVQPGRDGQISVEFRTPNAASSNNLAAGEADAGGPIDQILATWKLGPFARVPIGTTGAELFGSLPQEQSIESAERAQLIDLAARLDALVAGGEPADARDRRLTRVQGLSDVLHTLSTALDLRDVFDQLRRLRGACCPTTR